ncbi:MAG TPA: tRNA-binding protein [Candidatus Obscuribacterales bacterium]
MGYITYEDFDRVEIRVGRIVKVEDFPKARKPAYKIWVDFGDSGLKQSSAQLTKLYTAEELVGKQVLAVTNFPPRQVADFISEVLILGVNAEDNGSVALVQPDRPVPLGQRLY